MYTATTTIYKLNGEVSKMNGKPKSIASFEKKAANADCIEIEVYFDCHLDERIFLAKNENGQWQSPVFFEDSHFNKGYMRYVLRPMKKNYSLDKVHVSDEEARSLINASVPALLQNAEEVIAWCDPKDENDADGRYWVSAYRGAGVYRIIVKDGKIRGAIYGGFHNCRKSLKAALCPDESFVLALENVITKKIGEGFQLLKADGSGTYFFLRDAEDKKYLQVKEYDVPSADGGLHQNMEIV